MDKETLDQLQRELKASEDALKATLKTQADEIKAHGQTTAETSKRVEAAEKRLDQVVADVAAIGSEAVKKLTDQLDEATKRLDEMEKAAQRPGWPGSDLDPEELKGVGERFIESEVFKAAKAQKGRETQAFELKGLFTSLEAKAAFLSDAATRLVVPMRTDLLSPVLRRLRIRDLLPVRPTQSNAIEYLEEIGFAVSGAPSGTQTHGAAAPHAETVAAPEAQLEMELKTANVRDISHHIPASRQILDDMPMLRSYIDDRLIYGVGYVEETQLLYGDGDSPNLQGFMTHANRQTFTWSTDGQGSLAAGTADTKIDCIRRAMTKAHVREYRPTGVVLNPGDWEDIQLAKGSDQHYIWLLVSSGTEDNMFRVPVVVTNAINPGDGLVGSFAIGATLWDRQQANVRISEHHLDYFTRKLVAIMAEERLALTIYRPDAFVEIDFDQPPA